MKNEGLNLKMIMYARHTSTNSTVSSGLYLSQPRLDQIDFGLSTSKRMLVSKDYSIMELLLSCARFSELYSRLESNQQPLNYKLSALPLSYTSKL